MSWSTYLVSIVVGGIFLSAGANKFSSSELAQVAPEHLGISRGLYRIVGGLELLGVAGIWAGIVWSTGLAALAAFCLGLLMVGAVVLHIRAGDKFAVGSGFAEKSADSIKGWAPAFAVGMITFTDALLLASAGSA